MGSELRVFANHHCVKMADLKAAPIEQLSGVLEKQQARGTLPLGIRVWEMRADVAETGGSEERVAQGVSEYVSIGMSDRSLFERHFNSADHQLSAFRQAMKIVSNSRASHFARRSCSR